MLHYPRRKMVLTQTLELPPWGTLNREEYQKEELLEIFSRIVDEHSLNLSFGQELKSVISGDGMLHISTGDRELAARNVVVAVGRRGSPRKLGVAGEDQAKVMYRLMDAQAYRDSHILVVGGGDSAAEAAIGLARQSTNTVTLSYRKNQLVRLKKKNLDTIEKLIANGRIQPLLGTEVATIAADSVEIRMIDGSLRQLENDYVFVFAGGTPPFPLLKQMGIRFGGEAAEPASEPRRVPSTRVAI